MLVQHKSRQIHVQSDDWLTQLCHLADRFYREEARTGVRLAVLDVIGGIYKENRALLEVCGVL